MKNEYEMPNFSVSYFDLIDIIKTSDGEALGDIETGSSGSGGSIPMPTNF